MNRLRDGLYALFVLTLFVLLIWHLALGGDAQASGPDVSIPATSAQYRIRIEREAGAAFGLNAPTARLAAQIHQESHWRPMAASAYAQGLAQFTPATAAWLPNVCPHVGPPDVWDANWSIRAMICYDRYLYERVTGAGECDRWSFALSAYNGGLGWVNRDKARASAQGADAARWAGHVEYHTARAQWARVENRDYVRRILLVLEPAYIAAGWDGLAVCP